MAQLLTSLENETEIKSIERNNNLFEKKCASFNRQRDEIVRSMRNLELCNLQVKPMVSITKKKLHGAKVDAEKHLHKTKEIVQRSNDLLSSSFERVDLIRANHHHSLRIGVPSLSISLPYDSCSQNIMNEKERIGSQLEEISKQNEILKNEKENFEKLQHSTTKAKGKVEKEMMSLKEEHQRQSSIISELQNSSLQNKEKLINLKQDVSVATDEKSKLEAEVNSAEKIRDELLLTVDKKETLIANREYISKLDVFHSVLTSNSENIDPSSLENLPDCDEISKLFEELQKLETEIPQLSQSVPISDLEAVSTLETTLETIKNQTKTVLENIEQLKDFNNKYQVNMEKLARKKSGIEDVRKQILENTTTLGGLKVTENAAKPLNSESRNSKKEEVFRRLEATRNDVPGPEPYQPYRTPSHKASNGFKAIVSTIKTVSTKSGMSRQKSQGFSPYPGIKLINKRSSGTSVPRTVTPKKEDDSYLFDSTLLSEDSGTTQDFGGMVEMFGELNNNSSDAPPVVEFSMTDHMNEYSQRQANKMSSQTSPKDDDIHENEKFDVSVIESDDDDEDEEADEDEDDDLLAPDDQEDFDQSIWED